MLTDLLQRNVQLVAAVGVELMIGIRGQRVEIAAAEGEANGVDLSAVLLEPAELRRSGAAKSPSFGLFGIAIVAFAIADDDHDLVGIVVAGVAVEVIQCSINTRRQVRAALRGVVTVGFIGTQQLGIDITAGDRTADPAAYSTLVQNIFTANVLCSQVARHVRNGLGGINPPARSAAVLHQAAIGNIILVPCMYMGIIFQDLAGFSPGIIVAVPEAERVIVMLMADIALRIRAEIHGAGAVQDKDYLGGDRGDLLLGRGSQSDVINAGQNIACPIHSALRRLGQRDVRRVGRRLRALIRIALVRGLQCVLLHGRQCGYRKQGHRHDQSHDDR